MPSLASFTNQTTFLSDEIAVATAGQVRLLITLPGQARGSVAILLRNSGGTFMPYPELTFVSSTAVQLPMLAGDRFKIRFLNCSGAGIEVDQ